MFSINYLLVLLLIAPGIHAISAADEIQVGRYSTMKTLPTKAQKNIFSTAINIQFDSSVTTVGEAMRHLLQDQGIRLAVPRSDDASSSYFDRITVTEGSSAVRSDKSSKRVRNLGRSNLAFSARSHSSLGEF